MYNKYKESCSTWRFRKKKAEVAGKSSKQSVSVQNEGRCCRELLKEIRDLTYLCADGGALESLKQDLQKALGNFRPLVPSENGIFMEVTQPKKNIKAKPKKSHHLKQVLKVKKKSILICRSDWDLKEKTVILFSYLASQRNQPLCHSLRKKVSISVIILPIIQKRFSLKEKKKKRTTPWRWRPHLNKIPNPSLTKISHPYHKIQLSPSPQVHVMNQKCKRQLPLPYHLLQKNVTS